MTIQTTAPTTPTTPTAPAPGTPEYDAAMAAAFTGQASGPPAVPPLAPPQEPANTAKPDWLPEKFWTAEKGPDLEALAKSYAELEKAKSVAQPPAPKPGSDESAPGPAGAAPAEGGGKAPQINFDALGVELASAGELSAESLTALKGLGFTDDFVNSTVTAFKAQAELVGLQMESHVGGKGNLAAIQAWGKTNLSDQDRGFVDQQINAGNWKQALDYVAFKQSQAPKTQPGIAVATGAAAPVSTGFASQAQMMAAISDPRYMSDPAYRREVEQKIVNTSLR